MSPRLALPPAGSTELHLEGRRLRLTSLDKVLWPATGFTKGRMIEYYVAVADALLPHLAGRPLTLGRFPDGVEGPGFAQTECRGRPEWMATKRLRLRSGEVRDFCLIEDAPSLAWRRAAKRDLAAQPPVEPALRARVRRTVILAHSGKRKRA